MWAIAVKHIDSALQKKLVEQTRQNKKLSDITHSFKQAVTYGLDEFNAAHLFLLDLVKLSHCTLGLTS